MKSALRRRITPSVPFTLHVEDANGDKFSISFRLSYDFKALTLVEELTGKSMLTEVADVFNENPTVKNVSILLWAAVRENHPEWADEDGFDAIRANLTLATAKEALAACTEAFVKQLPAEQVARMKGEAPDAPPLVPSPAAA